MCKPGFLHCVPALNCSGSSALKASTHLSWAAACTRRSRATLFGASGTQLALYVCPCAVVGQVGEADGWRRQQAQAQQQRRRSKGACLVRPVGEEAHRRGQRLGENWPP
eukprot:6177060-Pleurochrysis_carterae.AAC.1